MRRKKKGGKLPKRALPLYVLAALALFALNSYIKLNYFGNAELFYSDAAFRYRYAREFAYGREIPEIDLRAQYPEGLKVRSLIHLTMDACIGYSYRLLAPLFRYPPFHIYVKYFVSIFSSLLVLGLFLLTLAAFGSPTAALLAALVYSVGVPSYWRVTGNYLREEFAMPFLIFALALFLSGLRSRARKRSLTLALLSGLCFSAGLISWHLSPFFLALFVFFVALDIILDYPFDVRQIATLFSLFLIPVFLASVLWPTLRAKSFLLSNTMLLSYWTIALGLISSRVNLSRRWRALLFLPVLPLMALITGLSPTNSREFSHVFHLLLYKALYFTGKPADPSRIPFDVRAIWKGPFSSTGPFTFAFADLLPLLLALPGAIIALRNKIKTAYLPLFLALFFFPLSLLVMRLDAFFFVFLSLFGGFALYRSLRTRSRWLLALYLIPLLMIGQTAHYRKLFDKFRSRFQKEWMGKFTAYGSDWERITMAIKNAVPDSCAILAAPDISAMVLTYVDRPIILHPIYESYWLRCKVEDAETLLYKTEGEFLQGIGKYRPAYLLYQEKFLLDSSRESIRYQVNRLKLRKNSLVYYLNFHPESLRALRLVYQTNTFRLYAFDTTAVTLGTPYSPFFDPGLYPQNPDSPYFDGSSVEKVREKVKRALGLYNVAAQALRRGDYTKAISLFRKVLMLVPDFEKSHYYLGIAYEKLGDPEQAMENYRLAREKDPLLYQAVVSESGLLFRAGKLREAVNLLLEYIGRTPYIDDYYLSLGGILLRAGRKSYLLETVDRLLSENNDIPPAYFYSASLLEQAGYRDRAVDLMEVAVNLDPENPIYRRELGRLYDLTGRRDRALEELRKSLELDPYQPQVKAVLKRLL